jgi:rare lipoprotein A
MSSLLLVKGGRAAGWFAAVCLTLIASPALAQSTTSRDSTHTTAKKKVITGKASFYGGSDGFDGQTTANGDTFDHHDHTAAAKSIPLGSTAKVTNLKTGKSTTVTVTDRGPYVPGRKIDLSKDAAREIGITKKEGVAPVKIVVTKPQVKEASAP